MDTCFRRVDDHRSTEYQMPPRKKRKSTHRQAKKQAKKQITIQSTGTDGKEPSNRPPKHRCYTERQVNECLDIAYKIHSANKKGKKDGKRIMALWPETHPRYFPLIAFLRYV